MTKILLCKNNKIDYELLQKDLKLLAICCLVYLRKYTGIINYWLHFYKGIFIYKICFR